MKYHDWDTPTGHLCREWRCCGLIWQMLVVPAWEGTSANFTCPRCGDMEEWRMPNLGEDFIW